MRGGGIHSNNICGCTISDMTLFEFDLELLTLCSASVVLSQLDCVNITYAV